MSYIAFDLDALNRAPAVARSAGVREEDIIAGLARMWAWCFREKLDTITADQLRGHFGADVAAALVAFAFLESLGDTWRVKGAERYLRISEARSKGGKAASKNLIPGGKKNKAQPRGQPKSALGSRSAAAEDQPRLTLGSGSALTPSTEHRAPNEEELAPAAPTPRESDLICRDFQETIGSAYRWEGAKDGKAFADLRKIATLEEIRDRWRRGLRLPVEQFVSCRSVAELAQKWNRLADAKPAPRVSIEHQPSRIL